MTPSAQCLPVAHIPEEHAIATMRMNVIYDGSCAHELIVIAVTAERVLGEVSDSSHVPLPVITSFAG